MLQRGTWMRRGSRIVIDLQTLEPSALDREFSSSQSALRKGSRGSAVADLQSRLAARGFNPGPADGIFGPATESAVRAFQQSSGSLVDGVVSASTWDALVSAPKPAPGISWVPAPSHRAVRVSVPFHGYRATDPSGCFNRCKDMARAVGVNVGGPDLRIQVGLSEDSSGRVRIDPAKSREGIAYIDSQLDAQKPVCVGVSYMDAAYNVDAITDHFVLITTRGSEPNRGTFYGFHDPATSDTYLGSDQNPANRFYLRPEGGLYRPPSRQKPLVGVIYDVSMVRRNA